MGKRRGGEEGMWGGIGVGLCLNLDICGITDRFVAECAYHGTCGVRWLGVHGVTLGLGIDDLSFVFNALSTHNSGLR